MHDHVSRFKMLLVNLKNLDEDIKDKVKVMILLHSLLEEYSHFATTLLYEKSVIIFEDVYIALTNLEIQNNDKHFERVPSEEEYGGKNSQSKSRSRNIARDECAFCSERGHWKKDYSKAQKKYGRKLVAANMAHKDEDSDYSLSITPSAYVANLSE